MSAELQEAWREIAPWLMTPSLGRETTAFWRSAKQHGLWFINAANKRTGPLPLAALDVILICCRDKIVIRCNQDCSVIAWLSQAMSKIQDSTQNKLGKKKKNQGHKSFYALCTQAEAGIWVDYPKYATAWFSNLDAKIMHVYYSRTKCI